MIKNPTFEFHINNDVRKACGLKAPLFEITGNVIISDFARVRRLAMKLNDLRDAARHPELAVRAGDLNAMGLIDEILHFMTSLYKKAFGIDVFGTALSRLETAFGEKETAKLLQNFCGEFPPKAVYQGAQNVDGYLQTSEAEVPHNAMALEELLMLAIANLNPAFKPFFFLFDDSHLKKQTCYTKAIEELKNHLALLPPFGSDGQNLWDLLRAPALACPDSLEGQLRWIREKWAAFIADFLSRILTSLDVISEEQKPHWHGDPGPTQIYDFGYLQNEYEKFSQDEEWMPRTILMAKSTLVWLYQLSKKYNRAIKRLDEIPEEEIEALARQGFTGLWLIGLWERSNASRTIKQWKGNPEAAASAYSLYDYDIAGELGGWGALTNLRERCARRGIRLGSDMVPNHTGIDSRWIMENPDRFLQLDYPPYPQYQYNSGNLANNDDVVVQIEDHYYNNSDCAVVFHHYDRRNNRHRYIYHGNDGTSMPWNDTAQIDFLNPEAREAVIRTIVGVCQQFPIVRFDAAMTLAKKHIQRLWYPEPGHGGDIASRAEHALSTAEFNARIPNEFWREVVDRCAAEAPHTLLLAEAFWMMEGYFVRTLGMHRVYNSAFMNMLKKEENYKYRMTIKNTLEFDPEILKRYVNFMNNPDEETAVAQFGKGDKYFGICTLMVTMPGLPMFGHGQIEGFEEKYGMEYRRAYRDETPDSYLIERHEREVFPLMKRRMLFSGSVNFVLFDFFSPEGHVNENVFAYSNGVENERALVFYNNFWERASGIINWGSVEIPQKDGTRRRDNLGSALNFSNDKDCFALLREQRSARWIIRSCKEIHERGLFVILNGYEAQVYTDIYEVKESRYQHWAMLHHKLNGGSVKDPREALQDMVLDEVYAPFWALFSNERTDGVCAFLTGGKQGEEEFKKALQDFFTAGQRFLKEGEYEPFKTAKKHTDCSAKDAVDACVKSLAGYGEVLKALKSGNSAFAKSVSEYAAGGKELGVLLYGFTVFQLAGSIAGEGASGAEAAALCEHWGLDRKFREAAEQLYGVDGGKAYRVTEIAKAVLRRVSTAQGEGAKPAWKSGKSSPADCVIESYESDDFKRILGINVWEGTVFFNKESFGEALFFSAVFALQFAGAAVCANTVEALTRAEAASGYRIGALIDALGAAKGTAASKPAAKSGTAKSGTAKPAASGTASKPAAPKTASAAKPAGTKPAAAKSTAAKPAGAKPAAKKPSGKK